MAEDIGDITGESNLLEQMNEITIGGLNGDDDDQKLKRSNPVFDAERPSSKVETNSRWLEWFQSKNKKLFKFSVRFSFAHNTEKGVRPTRKSCCSVTVYECAETIRKSLNQSPGQIFGVEWCDENCASAEHCSIFQRRSRRAGMKFGFVFSELHYCKLPIRKSFTSE